MEMTIHSSFLPHTDPDASVAFYRDALGFEVRLDVGSADMRWITVGPIGQPDTAIVLHPPTVNPGMTEHERETVLELIAEGSYFGINLETADLDDTFAQLESTGIEVAQEPINHEYGVRDCAFRDPTGNMIRIREKR